MYRYLVKGISPTLKWIRPAPSRCFRLEMSTNEYCWEKTDDNWKCHPWLADWGQGTQSTSECLLQESPSRTEHSTRFSQPNHLIVTYRKKRPLVFQREHDSDKHSPTGRVPSICRTIPEWNTLDSSIAQAGLFDKFKSRLAPPAL